jgi:hypothetical protein
MSTKPEQNNHGSANDCGNPHIDSLAAQGRFLDVWAQLRRKFPMVEAHYDHIVYARRTGALRKAIENDSRYRSISKPFGPENDAEWELLAYAALEAANFSPCGSAELYKRDGVWLEISQDHPILQKMHDGCAWCAKGMKPCPITNYPMAHV